MDLNGGKLTGDMLGFYIEGKALACEVSCDFNFAQDMKMISPYQAGGWQQAVPGMRSWQINVSGIFLSQFQDADFKTILKAFMNQTPMNIAMRTTSDYTPAFFIGGVAYPTSGSLSSPSNELVGYSTTFMGSGPLTYTSEASDGDFWRILNANPAQDDKPFYYQTTL